MFVVDGPTAEAIRRAWQEGGELSGIVKSQRRGRNGGRPFKMTAAKLRLAQAAMGQPGTKVGELCAELGVTRQTLYRHVDPKGALRPDGQKLLGRKGKLTPAQAHAAQGQTDKHA